MNTEQNRNERRDRKRKTNMVVDGAALKHRAKPIPNRSWPTTDPLYTFTVRSVERWVWPDANRS